MDYTYRVGEVKDLFAKVTATSDSQAVTLTSAKMRLLSRDNKLIWERNAVVVADGLIRYRMSDIKTKGDYKVQWVYVVGGQTRFSNVFTLTVKGATD